MGQRYPHRVRREPLKPVRDPSPGHYANRPPVCTEGLLLSVRRQGLEPRTR
ncbi:hypothetical protein SLNWT_2398 [Streptomyces albus]|uniref:Uncharacterized protein n=1 Tax=Streptomyces albus (strain ATCC 21838 / DSM 41398 / FERM P-419 / JCM 4703 / NBRC 107858) TaxID=1081613 RepID=A0A0B5EMK8_STRA4|nr:hypothetical protein SLNWT_2398 [Streptomyces albus]